MNRLCWLGALLLVTACGLDEQVLSRVGTEQAAGSAGMGGSAGSAGSAGLSGLTGLTGLTGTPPRPSLRHFVTNSAFTGANGAGADV